MPRRGGFSFLHVSLLPFLHAIVVIVCPPWTWLSCWLVIAGFNVFFFTRTLRSGVPSCPHLFPVRRLEAPAPCLCSNLLLVMCLLSKCRVARVTLLTILLYAEQSEHVSSHYCIASPSWYLRRVARVALLTILPYAGESERVPSHDYLASACLISP